MLEQNKYTLDQISAPSLLLKTVTLTKETQSIFDYEFKKNIKRSERKLELISSFIFIFRHNKESQLIFRQQNVLLLPKIQGAQLLGCFQILQCKGNGFTLKIYQPEEIIKRFNCQYCESLEKNYFIVRSLKIPPNQEQGYHLKTGQKLKIGRIEYEVIVGENESREWITKANSLLHIQGVSNKQGKLGENLACRICLSDEEGPDGMFFCHPCLCSGSCSVVHFKCLSIWCERKVKKEVKGRVTQYTLANYHCEICKSPYPSYFLHQEKKYPLIEFGPIPRIPYLILLEQKPSPTFFILEYSQANQFSLGRSHECEINITENSISRKHCRIQMHQGRFYLFDTKSKFGTLIYENQMQVKIQAMKRGFQMGRTVATFQMKYSQ